MGRLADRWHKTRLVFTLGTFLLKGSMFSTGRTVRGVFDKRFKREIGFSNLDLMTSTYEIMRDRLADSLKEIEHKNRVLEESRESLTGSRNFLQAIVDNLDVDLIVLDGQMRVVQTNEKLSLKYLGKAAAGRFCYEVSRGAQGPCNSPSCVCPLDEVKKTRKAVRLIQKNSAERTKEVKDRYLEVSVSPLFDENGDIIQFVELIRDVTESRELETRILEANRHLLVLNTISNAASQSLSLNIILNGALDKILELFKADTGGILLCDEKSGQPYFSVHRNLPEGSPVGLISLELAREVIETGETAKNNSSLLDPKSPADFTTLVGAPLKTKDKVVGVITVVSQTNRDFSLQEVQLLTSIGQQLGIIVENAQLYRELQVKEEARTELLRRIILAQEDERQRVARELHDVTSQTLATLAVGLQGLVSTPYSGEQEMSAKMEKMRNLLSLTSKDIHRLIYDLRPSLLDDLGLPAALRSCAHNSLDAAGIEAHMEVAGQERKLTAEAEIALFRIAQEAMANISKHARAESAYINLEYREKSVAVQIEDDGIGFDFSQEFSGKNGGVGLLGMKERAELLGGRLDIHTSPNNGTLVIVEIPTR